MRPKLAKLLAGIDSEVLPLDRGEVDDLALLMTELAEEAIADWHYLVARGRLF